MIKDKKVLFTSLIYGLIGGVVMSFLFLQMMNATGFIMDIRLVPMVLAAFFVPFCLRFLKRYGADLIVLLVCMAAVSFLITVLYGHSVSSALETNANYTSFFADVVKESLLLHGCFILGSAASLYPAVRNRDV